MTLKQLAWKLKKEQGLKHMHALEIASRYFGYGSYAAYQTSTYPPAVIDRKKVVAFTSSLGYDGETIVAALERMVALCTMTSSDSDTSGE